MKGKIARSTREIPSGISILLLGVAYFKGEGFSTSFLAKGGWWVSDGAGKAGSHRRQRRTQERHLPEGRLLVTKPKANTGYTGLE